MKGVFPSIFPNRLFFWNRGGEFHMHGVPWKGVWLPPVAMSLSNKDSTLV